MVRGDLIEHVPGSYVVLRLATGEIRRVEYASIASIQPADAPTGTAPAQQAPSAAPGHTAPPPIQGQPVLVVFRPTDSRAKLDQNVPGVGYVTICAGPCQITIDSAGSYRVSGRSVWDSDDFMLPAGRSSVTLEAEVVRTRRRAGGWTMFGLGTASVVLIGLPLMLAGASLRSYDDSFDGRDYWNEEETGRRFMIAGGVFTGLGVAGIVGGIMLATGDGTRVTFDASSGEPQVSLPGRFELTPAGLRF